MCPSGMVLFPVKHIYTKITVQDALNTVSKDTIGEKNEYKLIKRTIRRKYDLRLTAEDYLNLFGFCATGCQLKIEKLSEK